MTHYRYIRHGLERVQSFEGKRGYVETHYLSESRTTPSPFVLRSEVVPFIMRTSGGNAFRDFHGNWAIYSW